MNKTYSNQLKDFAKNNLQVHFADITVLEEAFTHSSYLNEHKYQCLSSNERLEFLGDAVINMAVAEELFIKYPDQNEGGLSKMRSLLINGSTLATVAKNIGIAPHIRVGKGEIPVKSQFKETILENALEAIIGAIVIDRGYLIAKSFTLRVLSEYLEGVTDSLVSRNPKVVLQEWLQKNRRILPEYKLVREIGKDPHKTFEIHVSVSGKVQGIGTGHSKIDAEKQAAQSAIAKLSIVI